MLHFCGIHLRIVQKVKLEERTLPAASITQPQDPVRAATRSCRIFLSYTHKNYEAGKTAFNKILQAVNHLKKEGHAVSEDDIFFDDHQFEDPHDWRQDIPLALSKCDMLVFLCSSDSLDSRYCIQVELASAAKLRKPVFVVYLGRIAKWDQAIRSQVDPNNTLPRLQIRGEMPLAQQSDAEGGRQYKPVNQWADTNDAWQRVAEQLGPFISATLFPGAIKGYVSQTKHGLGEPLPIAYYCDQAKLVSAFADACATWYQQRSQAMVAVLRSQPDAGLTQVAQRLRIECLKDKLGYLAQPITLQWPQAYSSAQQGWHGQPLFKALLMALGASPANPLATPEQAGEALHCALEQLHQAVVVCTYPRKTEGMTDTLADQFFALSQAMQSYPSGNPLWHKLIVFAYEESAQPSQHSAWLAPLHQCPHQHIHAVDLPPVSAVTQNDVIYWHQDQGLAARNILQEDLLQHFRAHAESHAPKPGLRSTLRAFFTGRGAANASCGEQLSLPHFAKLIEKQFPDLRHAP